MYVTVYGMHPYMVEALVISAQKVNFHYLNINKIPIKSGIKLGFPI